MRKTVLGMVMVAVLLVPAGAGAHNFKVGSNVTIKYSSGKFSGKVFSSKGFCRKRRKVVLFEFSGGTYKRVGKDYTNREGQWRISPSDTLGAFYAKAAFKKLLNEDHAHRCTFAESDLKQVSPTVGD